MALAEAPFGLPLKSQFLRLCSREHKRKNFLFSNTPQGARASAITYSLVETAKENELDPYLYLEYLFQQMPNTDLENPEALGNLLPWSEHLPEQVHKRRKKKQ